MILLQAHDVSRRFGDETLYEKVNFSIQERDRIALVGRNGTGKSTLLKQIMGQEPINNGHIAKAKGLKIGYLEQHVALHSPKSIWEEMENVFKDKLQLREQAIQAADEVSLLAKEGLIDGPQYHEALKKYDQLNLALEEKNAFQIESDIRTVLHGFGFTEEDYDRPIQSLSGGQKTRLALAAILLKNYDLLILDEPTNHLDMETLAWLESFLQTYQGALLIVSHDRYFLDNVVNQVYELRHQEFHHYKGNYSYYIEEKATRQAKEWKEYLKQQSQIAKLEDFIQKNIVRASTTKRAQSRRKQLDKMQRIDKPLQDKQAPRIQFSTMSESGERVIDCQELAIGYPNVPPLSHGIDLDLRKQDAIAIVGPNGIGKSTLLKTLIGQLHPKAGQIHFGSNVDYGYYAQNVNALDGDLTVLETLWKAHDTTDEWKIRSILASFLFDSDSVDKKVSLLSGGEKARLALALLACDHDNTLILDEPTNHLDIDSKEVLEQALIEYDGTLLFVSHDRYFINRIASKVFELHPDGGTLYLGDFDYYMAKKKEQAAFQENSQTKEASPIAKPSKVNSYEENKQLKREYRKLLTAVEEALEENDQLEDEKQKLHDKMIEASHANDQDQLLKLDQALKLCQDNIEQALEKWETATLALEDFETENPELTI